MYKDEYADCLNYIDSYWEIITQNISNDNSLTGDIGLPYPYLSPNTARFRNQFYWDSYFMMLGVLGSKHQAIISTMVDNFKFLFDKFSVFPNASTIALINRSQPPFFSDMILLKFQISNDKFQMSKDFEYAKREYDIVWTNYNEDSDEIMGTYHHTISGSILSRYGDRDAGYALTSELESGWDLTSRFGSSCNDYLPVDLNSLLYRYEQNFVAIAKVLSQNKFKKWQELSKERQMEMNKKMWNEKNGFYFDYNYKTRQQSTFYSLAGFVPLWAGLATKDQAEKMRLNLSKFETKFGLTVTAKKSISVIDLNNIPQIYQPAVKMVTSPKQWDYPNSWPPLEYLVVTGLLRYGFNSDAKRLMEKYVKTHATIFRKYKLFAEKINAETGDITGSYHYKNQDGFGWTNAVFKIFVELLDGKDFMYYFSPLERG